MAIGTTPLLSGLSGSTGPIDYRTRRNGKIEIGKKRIPSNPQSTEQQNTRNAYGRLHELWQNATWIDQTQYENIAAAYDISSWNAFLMRHLPTMRLNPVAYWPFVEGTGSTLHDFTTNENHGTIFGSTWELLGKYDIPKLYFDGLDDYINVPNSDSLNLTDKMSIMSYQNLDEDANTGYIISKNTISVADAQYTAYFQLPPPRIKCFINGLTRGESADNSVNKGDAYHQMVRYDRINVEFYINGALSGGQTPYTPAITPTNHSVNIGRRKPSDFYYKGPMFELSVFNTPIQPEINTRLYKTSKKFYEV